MKIQNGRLVFTRQALKRDPWSGESHPSWEEVSLSFDQVEQILAEWPALKAAWDQEREDQRQARIKELEQELKNLKGRR